mmetsp:Transcript_38147/g.61976  ORF Transcript_38147/g.61976 Transcript_38147/m.61976 type:complete len:201 (+) Transcript_38147:1113-1715(+)
MSSTAKYFQIKVPAGVTAGTQLQVRSPNGVDLVFSVPPNCPPGSLLRVPMPASPAPTPVNPAQAADPATGPANAQANATPPPAQSSQEGPPSLPASNPPGGVPATASTADSKDKEQVVAYTAKALSTLHTTLTKKKDELKDEWSKLDGEIDELKTKLEALNEKRQEKKEEYENIVNELPKLEEMSKKFSGMFASLDDRIK